MALELGALVLAATLFLGLVPQRPVFVDVGLALLGLGLVALTARDTRERVWGAPVLSQGDRVRHSTRHLSIATAAVALLFAGWRIRRGGPLVTPTLLAALVAFGPWALLQQTLFQFCLLGRVRVLLAGAPAVVVAAVNGLLFGAAHLPDWDVTVVTIVAGSVWSWYYLRDRCLLPIALSHAVLGTAYFYWVRGEDLLRRWLTAL